MKINMLELFEKMKGDQVVVLNVLSKGDFKRLHINGSQSHPMTGDPAVFSKEVEEKYGKAKSFVAYGDRFGLLESYLAVKALEDHGLRALNYSGGLQEWHKAGLPVEGTQLEEELAAKP